MSKLRDPVWKILKGGIYIVINSLPQAGEVLHGCFPVLHQDFRGQLAPQRAQGVPICRWNLGNTHNAELEARINVNI